MNCPTCQFEKNIVTRTVSAAIGVIERDRQCCNCGFRWKTVESKHADWERAKLALELAAQLQRLTPEG